MGTLIVQGMAMLDPHYKLVPVGRDTGLFAVVDDEDYDRCAARYWSLTVTPSGKRYAHTTVYDGTVGLHRFVMNCTDPALVVDHRDGHGLNNRRGNLREATKEQNGRNKGASSRSKSGVPGVEWSQRWRMWEVTIRVNGVRLYVDSFKCLERAAAARSAAELEHYGDFARSGAVSYVDMLRERAERIAAL